MGYRIDLADLTLDQLDQVNKLVETGRAGKVTAVAFVALHEQDPSLTLAAVRAMKQSDIEVVKTVEVEEDDESLGPIDGP